MEAKKTAVITGATSGIGLATAISFIEAGICVIGIGRNETKCESAKHRILQAFPNATAEFLACDLSSQTQIRVLANSIAQRVDELDVLVNNAGTVSSHFMTSEDGIELQFAVNHLAPFLLTYELLPLILRAKMGRIITVSSGSHYGTKLNFMDLQMRRRYSCIRQYKRVKLCNVMFTAELSRRLGPNSHVRAYAVDPGLVNTSIGLKGTSGIEKLFWKLRMKHGVSPDKPASCIRYLASEQNIPDGNRLYWHDLKPKVPNPYAMDKDAARLLWRVSEAYCRIDNTHQIVAERIS